MKVKLCAILVVIILGATVATGNIVKIRYDSKGSIEEDTKIFYTVMTDIPPKPSPKEMRLRNPPTTVSTSSSLPSYFSWKDYDGKDFTSPVKTQGNCGSCWAFSACAMIESKLNIVLNNANLDLDLSEQYILSCLPEAGDCGGGWTSQALNYILSESPSGNNVNGIVTENCFPYVSGADGDVVDCSNKCDDWMDKLWELSDYGSYTFDTSETSRNSIKQLLIQKGPLGVHFLSTDDFVNWGAFNHNPDDYYPYNGPVASINHAVILVGYKDDPSIPNGGYWILKNSWGTGFGYGGFFNLEYKALGVDRDILWVDVPQGFIVDFTYSPGYVTKDDLIEFSVISSLDIISWWWSFGDGYYSDLENPLHRYYENGVYDVTLTVVTSTGSIGNTTKTIHVPSGLPEADFDFSPINPSTSDTITFTDKSTGNVMFWDWDFGDGSISFIQHPFHRYTDDGFYTINLTVEGLGTTSSIEKEIYVSNQKPTAEFSYIISENGVEFSDESYDPDGTIESWLWDFGDGNYSNEQNPIHLYGEGDEFTVSLTVKDDDNGQDAYFLIVHLSSGEEFLDQYQETYTSGEVVKYGTYPAQSFKPTVSKITKMEIFLKKDTTLTKDITLSVKSSLSGPPLASISKKYQDIPSDYSWIVFDIADIDITPGETYYILLTTSSYSWSRVYMFAYAQYNSYNDGILHYTRNLGRSWDYWIPSDMCFRVYGY